MGSQSSKANAQYQSSTPGAATTISYEVILSPRMDNARVPRLTPKKFGLLTRQDIDDKITAAENRRKTRELNIRLKMASNVQHADMVCQAMKEYEERKRRETEERYQRRLFIFAENQEMIANQRANKWQEKRKKIEMVQESVERRDKNFRNSVKEKLKHKFDKLKDNCNTYNVSRQEASCIHDSKTKQVEKKALKTTEHFQKKLATSQENPKAKNTTRQKGIEEEKQLLIDNIKVANNNKDKQFESGFVSSGGRQQLNETEENRSTARTVLVKVELMKEIHKVNEQQSFQTMTGDQSSDIYNGEKILEKCQKKNEEKIMKQEIEVQEPMKAKVNYFKENCEWQRRDNNTVKHSSVEDSLYAKDKENDISNAYHVEKEDEKHKELSENFRNHNLEHLSLR